MMKNTHCCMCGSPRGVAPVSTGWGSDTEASGIFRPCLDPNRNPAPGVHLEESPSLCIQASVWRNGGTSADVHVCATCTTKAVRHLRDILNAALGAMTTPSPTPAPEFASATEAIHADFAKIAAEPTIGHAAAMKMVSIWNDHIRRVRPAAPEQPAQAKPFIKTYRITDDNLVGVEQPAQAKAVGDAGSGMIPSLVRRNAEKDPAYCPYCLRCDTGCRMVKVGHMQWKCTACPAVHDERTPDERATPPASSAEHPAVAALRELVACVEADSRGPRLEEAMGSARALIAGSGGGQ